MGKNCQSVLVCIIDVLNVFTLFYTLKEDYPNWKGRLKASSGPPHRHASTNLSSVFHRTVYALVIRKRKWLHIRNCVSDMGKL